VAVTMFNAGRASGARPTSCAGTPTAVYPDGTGATTNEPAPILAKSPMSTLPNTVAPADGSTPRPIRGAPAWPSGELLIVRPCSIDTSSPITTPSPMVTPVPRSITADSHGRMDVDMQRLSGAVA
jgi:hypothetical protein